MTVTTSSPMSLEDYLRYDDGTERRYELVDGVVVDIGAESDINIQIVNFLFVCFLNLGVPHYLISNKTEIVVSSRLAKTRYPDLMVKTEALDEAMPSDQRSIVMPEMPAPRLVVEVVSPGEPGEDNYDRDYLEKRWEYALRGIPEYWIVDPTHGVVLILALEGAAYREVGCFQDADSLLSLSFGALPLTVEEVLRAGR